MKTKIQKKLNEVEEIKCFIHYIFDIDKWESKLYPSRDIKPVLEFKSFNETYALDKIAYYIDGKPVFVVIRGIPYSVEFEKLNETLKVKGYSAAEIDAKINSIYVNHVFRKGGFSFRDYLSWILSLVVTALSTYIITYFSVTATSTIPTNPVTNSTIGGP